jgi:demethylmenaquinone methyltransferase/2-methoxy-6-polyprenyl-1,4-benzoquinol methylase
LSPQTLSWAQSSASKLDSLITQMDRPRLHDHAHYVRDMFTRISDRYDLLNRLMTFGQDLRCRREAVHALCSSDGSCVLDVGAGTGDLSLEIQRSTPNAMVVAVDFTPGMIARGRAREENPAIHWVVANAENLPFPARAFDGVISGFLLRNLLEVDRALAEQARILRPGGTMVSLDAIRAEDRRSNPFLRFYFSFVIPLLGRLVAGDAEAYNYLPSSMEAFLSARELSDRIEQTGFMNVAAQERMFGTIAIHSGRKPEDRPAIRREDR